jgi:TolB-like protein
MIYRFDRFELDMAKGELRDAGQFHPLERRVFALLSYLVEHRERLVSRDELLERVWDGRIVSEASISSCVKAARQAIGDDGKTQRFIRTVHGSGFRFVAAVELDHQPPSFVTLSAPETAGSMPSAGTSLEVQWASRPSIAVLPFRSIGDASPSTPIGEGLPHELITELARLRWLFVTARGSSFRLRSADPDMSEVGRVLGVSYCLTGTVEATGRQLTVTTELIDTRDAGVVWADRYVGSLDDVHVMRTEIRSQVLAALELQIPLHEASRARLMVTEEMDAWSAYHLGLQHVYRFNRKDNGVAATLFGRAVALDPGFARAHAGLSFVHFQTAFMHHSNDIAGETALARRCAERGLELDPLDPFVNFTMGRSYWLEGELEQGLAWLQRATSLSPNFAQGLYARAWTETLAGQGLEGRRHVDLAMRLSPLDPLYYAMLGTRAFTHMAQGEDTEAASWAERAARAPGAHVLIAIIAMLGHALAGNDALAQAWAADVRRRRPGLTSEDVFKAYPIKPAPMRARIAAALARLGF